MSIVSLVIAPYIAVVGNQDSKSCDMPGHWDKATMEAQFIKDECEEALEMAMPALNDAISALNTLKPQDISGIFKKKVLIHANFLILCILYSILSNIYTI